MVKNEKGGCNGKKVAHKHAVKSTKSGLRISQNKSEIYGVVKRLNGNTFDVTCIDDKERRCFIRGKFKGRGKRDNIIEVDKWVLIGIREFQQAPKENAIKSNSKGKKEMEMCDLLEVYSSGERDTLKRTHAIFMKESELSRADVEDSYDFVDADTLRYQKIVSSSSSSSMETIKMKKGVKPAAPENNMVNPQAMYGDVNDINSDSDDDEDDDNSEEESEDQDQEEEKSKDQEEEEEEEEEEDQEEEEEESQKKYYADKSKSNNSNKMCKVAEINVDDI
jgi:translation initiation factor IF-1